MVSVLGATCSTGADSSVDDSACGASLDAVGDADPIGVDVSERFDFSVLAAPNTTDVPPQGTVTYQLNPNSAVSGSVNSNGTWQSQLQMFFRF